MSKHMIDLLIYMGRSSESRSMTFAGTVMYLHEICIVDTGMYGDCLNGIFFLP